MNVSAGQEKMNPKKQSSSLLSWCEGQKRNQKPSPPSRLAPHHHHHQDNNHKDNNKDNTENNNQKRRGRSRLNGRPSLSKALGTNVDPISIDTEGDEMTTTTTTTTSMTNLKYESQLEKDLWLEVGSPVYAPFPGTDPRNDSTYFCRS
jgi:hypothetical protein